MREREGGRRGREGRGREGGERKGEGGMYPMFLE